MQAYFAVVRQSKSLIRILIKFFKPPFFYSCSIFFHNFCLKGWGCVVRVCYPLLRMSVVWAPALLVTLGKILKLILSLIHLVALRCHKDLKKKSHVQWQPFVENLYIDLKFSFFCYFFMLDIVTVLPSVSHCHMWTAQVLFINRFTPHMF